MLYSAGLAPPWICFDAPLGERAASVKKYWVRTFPGNTPRIIALPKYVSEVVSCQNYSLALTPVAIFDEPRRNSGRFS